jgi:hypothetical protein
MMQSTMIRPAQSTASEALAHLTNVAPVHPHPDDDTLLADLLAFGATLTPPQVDTLAHLIGRVSRAVEHQIDTEDRAHLQRLFAHLPGLRPALEVLDAHVSGCELLACPACDDAAPTA